MLVLSSRSFATERPDPCMGLGYEAWLLCAGKSKQLSSYFSSLLGMIITRVISSQGDRTKKVGVVDAEYITHLAIPSLGANSDVETASSSSLDLSLIIDPLFAILIYFYYLGANGSSVWLFLCR